MIKTLIIYDNAGFIFLQISGNYEMPKGGVQFLEVEIPQGKYLKSIDVTVTPNTPIYEDIPQTDMEQIKSETELLKGCVMELANIVYSSEITTESGV